MKEMEKNSFLSGKILRPLIHFSIPLMLALLLQALYGGVDLAVVGLFGNASELSAVATGSQVMQSITVLISGYRQPGYAVNYSFNFRFDNGCYCSFGAGNRSRGL